MMLPILISVSLTPGSYFFCAFAGTAMAATEINDTRATRLVRRSILSSRLFFAKCCFLRSVASHARAGKDGHIPLYETSCCGQPIVMSMRGATDGCIEAGRLEVQKFRVGPRHPRLGAASFRLARWLARMTMGKVGFHELGSDFAN